MKAAGIGKPKANWPVFGVILAVVALLVNIYIALQPQAYLLQWFSNDDAFYYFKVAQNVAAGLGSTFDGVNLSNGYHPLWMLVLVPVYWIAGDNNVLGLRLIVILSGLISAASAFFLYKLICAHLGRLLSFLLASLWVLSPVFYSTTIKGGMETALTVLFFLILLSMVDSNAADTLPPREEFRRLLPAGAIAALLFLSRLDNVFFVGIIGILFVVQSKQVRLRWIFDIGVIMVATILAVGLRAGWNFRVDDARYLVQAGSLLAVSSLVNLVAFIYEAQDGPAGKSYLWRLPVASIAILAIHAGIVFLFSRLNGSNFPAGTTLAQTGLYVAVSGAVSLWLYLRRRKGVEGKPASDNNKFTAITGYIPAALGYLLIPVIVFGIYALVNYRLFGLFSPVSGQIKTWWGTLGYTVYGSSVHNLKTLGEFITGEPLLVFKAAFSAPLLRLAQLFPGLKPDGELLMWTGLLLAAGLPIIFDFKKSLKMFSALQLLPLLAGLTWHMGYYILTGYVHTREWYWVWEAFLAFVVISNFIRWIWEISGAGKLEMPEGRRYRWAVWVVFILAALNIPALMDSLRKESSFTRDFYIMVDRIEELTPPGSYIGITGGGGIAYFIEGRTVVNLDGLINSKTYFEKLQAGVATEILDTMPLGYVYANKFIIQETKPYRDNFAGRLKPVEKIQQKYLFEYLLPGESQ